MRDLNSNIALVVAIPAAAYTADNTPTAIDLQGFGSAVIELAIGVGGITFTGTNKVEFKLTHSNDDITYEAVELRDVQGIGAVGVDGIIHRLIAAHAAATVHKIGYVGGRRYLKLLADFAGTHGTATPFSATVIKGHPAIAPVA